MTTITEVQLRMLIRRWKRKAKEYNKAVEPEWERGDRYASRRYEGMSTAFRWCYEDLEKLL